jgi:hypothetical protein
VVLRDALSVGAQVKDAIGAWVKGDDFLGQVTIDFAQVRWLAGWLAGWLALSLSLSLSVCLSVCLSV